MGVVFIVGVLAAGAYLVAPSRSGAPRQGGAVEEPEVSDKMATIARGREVNIEHHLEDGRFTVVEFAADW